LAYVKIRDRACVSDRISRLLCPRASAWPPDAPRWGSPIWAADHITERATAQVQRPCGVPFDAFGLGTVHNLFGC
jgi:hypothetical protein